MKRKSDLPLEKVTISLVKGDLKRMMDLFPTRGGSYAIRMLVNKYLQAVAQRAARGRAEGEVVIGDIETSLETPE